MTVDADGEEVKYDGTFDLKAVFDCLESEQRVWLNADPVVSDKRNIRFRSERCPHCGNNHWREKEYQLKYE